MDSIVASLVDLFNNVIPHEVIIFMISMLPVLELRGGILAASLLHVDWGKAFFICAVGTLLPIPFILLFIKQIFKWLSNTRLVKLVHRLEKKAADKSEKINRYKSMGLFVFVAVPLPGTGAWTGALAASFLEMPFKQAMASIALGTITADIIMCLLSYGLLGVFL